MASSTSTPIEKAWIPVQEQAWSKPLLESSPYAQRTKKPNIWAVFRHNPLLKKLKLQSSGFDSQMFLYKKENLIFLKTNPSAKDLVTLLKTPEIVPTDSPSDFLLTGESVALLIALKIKGTIADPEGILPSNPVAVFDSIRGELVIANSPQAQNVFDKSWTSVDVLQKWSVKGLQVPFADALSKEIYNAKHSTAVIPDLKLPLFPYQSAGVSNAAQRQGFLIADTPGLGKTPQGIAAALLNLQSGIPVYDQKPARVVIVCPPSLVAQWVAEIEKFTSIAPIEISGTAKTREQWVKHAVRTPASWSVMHYDLVPRMEEILEPLFTDAFLILDEVHSLKNSDALRTQTMARLRPFAMACLGLSGTPLDNRPDELYNVFNVILPGILGDKTAFQKDYMLKTRTGEFYGFKNLDLLGKRVSPFLIRRTKQEVAPEMPPLQISSVRLNVDEEYRVLLKELHLRAAPIVKKMYSAESNAEKRVVKGLLKRACLSPSLLHTSLSPAAAALVGALKVPDVLGVKVDYVKTFLQEYKEANQRAVVFCASRSLVHALGADLHTQGIHAVAYTGSESYEARNLAVQEFTDPKSNVTAFIATDAAAEGLNLGKCCSTLIQMDIPFTTRVVIQRMNRIHRIDSTSPAYQVINLCITDTVEDSLIDILSRKIEMVNQLFSDVSQATVLGTNIGEDDLFVAALEASSLAI